MKRKRPRARKFSEPEHIPIRKATSNDFRAIRTLVREYPKKLLQNHLPKPSAFFVAVQGKNIIGCCALEVYSKRLGEIRSLAIKKEFQGQGIATALLETCLRAAKKRKVYEVLTITGATSLFEKKGFGTFQNEKYALLKVLG